MTPAAVLDFWFADGPDAWRPAWFTKDPAFDAAIAARFGDWIGPAGAGRLAHWTATPSGTLALLILLDQFPRNLFRGKAAAFAQDEHARRIARPFVATGGDLQLTPTQRVFAYLPFEHSEDLADQDLACALFGGLRDHPALVHTIDYAWRHRAIIARFGRFPHRNAALGRASTAAEVAMLAQPGAGF